MVKYRVGFCVLKKGVKRPAAKIFQAFAGNIGLDAGETDAIIGEKGDECIRKIQSNLGITADGECGQDTWTAIHEAYPQHLMINPLDLLQEITCFAETSARPDPYGFAEDDIGDNAGANYGVLQHNRLGSLEQLLKENDALDILNIYNSSNKYVVNPEVRDWMGSIAGIKAQNNYFILHIVIPAMKERDRLNYRFENPLMDLRFLGLFTDSMTQNGTMYSTGNGPFVMNLEDAYEAELYYGTEWNAIFGEYCTYNHLKDLWNATYSQYKPGNDNKEEIKAAKKRTNFEVIYKIFHQLPAESSLRLQFLAQYRARTSYAKYWRVVLKRRNLFALGTSTINGVNCDLTTDYCLDSIDPTINLSPSLFDYLS